MAFLNVSLSDLQFFSFFSTFSTGACSDLFFVFCILYTGILSEPIDCFFYENYKSSPLSEFSKDESSISITWLSGKCTDFFLLPMEFGYLILSGLCPTTVLGLSLLGGVILDP
jgi:hypothetical protein